MSESDLETVQSNVLTWWSGIHTVEKIIPVGYWEIAQWQNESHGLLILCALPSSQPCLCVGLIVSLAWLIVIVIWQVFPPLVSSMLTLTPPWHQKISINTDLTMPFLWMNLQLFLTAFQTKSRLLCMSHEPLQDLALPKVPQQACEQVGTVSRSWNGLMCHADFLAKPKANMVAIVLSSRPRLL